MGFQCGDFMKGWISVLPEWSNKQCRHPYISGSVPALLVFLAGLMTSDDLEFENDNAIVCVFIL